MERRIPVHLGLGSASNDASDDAPADPALPRSPVLRWFSLAADNIFRVSGVRTPATLDIEKDKGNWDGESIVYITKGSWW